MKTVRLFRNDGEACFVSRPNRFLIMADMNGKKLACHCPNPGRLEEFLFPGAPLILEKRGEAGRSQHKTEWTTVAIRRGATIAPLYASRANQAAEILILPEIIPHLKEIHREYSLGSSRFDFLLLDQEGTQHIIEVKACSLVENNIAMFPDAPSLRALRHLEELAELSKAGYSCHVLFVILHSNPHCFIPNLHTDPAFSVALSSLGKKQVNIHAALLKCKENGMAELVNVSLPVDLSHGDLAAADKGNYLIVCHIKRKRRIQAGGLGMLLFEKGWYVYSGSGKKNLTKRINRHLRKQGKKMHWHLDYLIPFAEEIQGLGIKSYNNLECELAGDLEKLGGQGISGFGSSDCHCKSHLFYFPFSPLENSKFMDLLFYYRHVKGLKP